MQIEAARNMSVVLYDLASQRGWLVDGASALLHVVRTQVIRKPYGGSGSLFNNPNFNSLTFNHPKVDGGPDAAAEILQDERNMKHVILREFDSYTDETISVPRLEGDSTIDDDTSNAGNNASEVKSTSSTEEIKAIYKTTCLRELVSQTWSTLEQIHDRQIDYTTTHSTKPLRSPFRDALEGYEFMDIVSTKHILMRRSIHLESNGLAWRDFTERIQAITLFGRDFGDIYKPTPNLETQICKDWRTVPQGHEYLAAPVSLLKDIKQHRWEEGDVDLDSPEMAQGLFWIPPREPFSICRSGCKHVLPDRVQKLRTSIPGKTSLPGNSSWGARMFAEANGAIIFGGSSILDVQKLEASSRLIVGTEDNFHDSGLGSSLQARSRADSTEANSSGGTGDPVSYRTDAQHMLHSISRRYDRSMESNNGSTTPPDIPVSEQSVGKGASSTGSLWKKLAKRILSP
jgi:hypothetical protein